MHVYTLRPRRFAVKIWLRAVLGGLVLVGLVACGGAGVGGGGDDTGNGGGGGADEESQWEFTQDAGTTVAAEGTSVMLINGNQVVLSDSTPANWIITFTTEDPIDSSGLAYVSDNATRRVTATITAPSGDSCTVPYGTFGVTLTVLPVAGVTASGVASFADISDDCLASDVKGGGAIGFVGVP
jgi:hypothetical protein